MKIFNRKITQRGKSVFGGLVATAVIAGGIFAPRTTTTGGEKGNDERPRYVAVEVDIAGTGSTAAKSGTAYDAYCGDNPFNTDFGSGLVMDGGYHNISDPVGTTKVQVGFVESCDDKTLSGAQLLASASVNSGTGAFTAFDSEDVVWNGDLKLKVIITSDPTSSFDGKLVFYYNDILGE